MAAINAFWALDKKIIDFKAVIINKVFQIS